MSLALHQIDANHFSQGWLAKIKTDVPADNKHLKANNLRKIIAAIVEFNESVVHFVKLPDFPLPNVNAAAEGHREEIGRMLQLILGCAVNCENKQEYIESIMNLEESVQQVLMLAIQEMIKSSAMGDHAVNVMSELEDSNREREELRQRCHELEIQVKLLSEDKSIISAELDKLQEKVKGTGQDLDDGHSQRADYQIKDLRRQLEKGQEDVYKMEREKIELVMEKPINISQIQTNTLFAL